MTCCTIGEQLFTWQTAYPDMTIEEIGIHPTWQLSSTHPSWSSLDVPGLTVGVVDDDTWSSEAHEWDICCKAPYPTVSAELCVPNLDLHCIGLSTEPVSGADFTLPNREQPTSRAVSVILVSSLRAITICPLSNSLKSAAFPITCKSKYKNDYLPSPAAVTYHSHLTTCPPHHPDEFIEKCGSQFSRIHEDEEMPSEDKFQYLIQAITPGTRVANLIESFPSMAQNYPKTIELLKERFGR
ncbi:hypothetical protein AVEN_256243-1 [Araneus ventricosus]|uniref:Uncharacterized protein n=1 Tax=Araneus ventricosus TaxID=182803 RepID=A0A4Y2IMU5_ARAVE|nr:hypothetical protein AVEN_256243-1 [Araneus ventricosus]